MDVFPPFEEGLRPLARKAIEQEEEPAQTRRLSCPAAPEDWPNAVAFGIVAGTPAAPRVQYLAAPVPVPTDLPVTPREVLRISADCQESGCRHWRDDVCSLVTRVLERFDPVTTRIPPCRIRSVCRWWHQEGRAACARCPGIVTDSGDPGVAGVEYL